MHIAFSIAIWTIHKWNETRRTIEVRYGLSSLNRSFSSNKMLPDNFPHPHTQTPPIPPPCCSPLTAVRQARAPVALLARLASGQWQLPLPFTNLHSIRRQLAAGNPAAGPTSISCLRLANSINCLWNLWNAVEATAAWSDSITNSN